MFTDELIESLKNYYLTCRQIKQEAIMSGLIMTENSIPAWWDS